MAALGLQRRSQDRMRVGTNAADPAYLAMSDADACRKMANECRREAARAVNPVDQQRWLQMSEQWLRLAEAAEQGTSAWPRSRGSQ
jgi:hypothetical protein